jgi:hypothetical protein
MKIEFKKVPLSESEFKISQNSVNFLGTFSKISQKVAKLNGNICGDCEVECCKCGDTFLLNLNEEVELLLSDGIYSCDIEEIIVVEVENHIIDFNDILHSELESLKSEYYLCDKCQLDNKTIKIEY